MQVRPVRFTIALVLAASVAFICWRHWIFMPPPLLHSAYIWQREWNNGLRQALMQSKESLSDWVVLAAEVDFPSGGHPRAARAAVDYDILRSAGRPVGLAVRISSFGGPFDPAQAETRFLVALVREVLDQARRNGVEPNMVQLDFDAPVSKLEGYRQWLKVLRREVAPTPLVITALPSWMESPAFAGLTREADAYVLQVHSLDATLSLDTIPTLCDPKRAESAVALASRLGHPFWVALPTYGYQAWFDNKGKLLHLVAEGQTLVADNRFQRREVRADPVAMAGLVRRFAAKRPAGMKGIIWYRLPHPDDQMNWSWTTLQAVMQGRKPQAETEVHLDQSQPGLVEVSLQATGEADSLFGDAVLLDWRDASLVAADGMAGFVAERGGPESLGFFFRGGALLRLAPGRSQVIGWLRFNHHAEVSAHVEELHH